MKFRISVAALLAALLTIGNVGTSTAGTTGTISGTVTDAATHLPLAGVAIAAVAPTGHYAVSTDAKGFFSLAGVTPDTYTVSFERAGYQPQSLSGVNVFADQAANTSVALAKALATIGRVTARSQGGAFQPTQTQDTYTITPDQIKTLQGKTYNASETQLLSTLPGVTVDSSGYPDLRGGRENEEGFEFEGIDYTDAFLHQFVNSLALNNPGQLQVTPGSGDASHGNNGTGSINLLTKRGTYPAFGSLDLETLLNPFDHRLGFDYGFATPNGRISNYITFLGDNQAVQNGPRGAPAASLSNGAFFGLSEERGRDIIDNFIVKFGPNQNQSLQLLYQNQQQDFILNYGGISTLNFKTDDPLTLAELGFSGLTNAQIQSVVGLLPYQSAAVEALNKPSASLQPNETFKIQYSINPNSSTFVAAKFYTVSSAVTFDYPYADNNLNFSSHWALQGGLRKGTQLDVTKQVDSKNLLKLGGKYDFQQPVFDYVDNIDGLYSVAGGGFGYDVASFLPPSQVAHDTCPLGPGYCSYLEKYFPGGVTVPDLNFGNYVTRQDFSLYASDSYSPTDRLRIEGGLRMDSANYQLPAANSGLYPPSGVDKNGNPVYSPVPNDEKNPYVYEPRLAASWEVSRNDAVRASFGRAVNFAPIAFVNSYIPPNYYSKFANVPSYDALGAASAGVAPGTPFPATWCGISSNQTCTSFAQQLYWNYQTVFGGLPVTPAKPETFSNYEFSYSHQFPHSVSFKLTPFYRRGYDALAVVATPKLNSSGQVEVNPDGTPIQNPPMTTNLGREATTGVEFLLTKEAAFGFSGALSATYINELSNVIPGSPGEDFFPSIPPASLALGNLYRVGFLSPFQSTLAVQYRTHSGFRINPIISYNKGYPIGAGLLTAAYLNGVPLNLPNTNVTDPNGSNSAPQYVDPQSPGTLTKPNIVASRGTPETSSAGGLLSSARLNTDLTFEYNKPGSRTTVGIGIANLFGNVYNLPATNPRYQPVATGISGPLTGSSTLPLAFPGVGLAQYGANRFGYNPYLIDPDQSPTTVRLYYQVAL